MTAHFTSAVSRGPVRSGRYKTSWTCACTGSPGEDEAQECTGYGSAVSATGPTQLVRYAADMSALPPSSGPRSKPERFARFFSEKSAGQAGSRPDSRDAQVA